MSALNQPRPDCTEAEWQAFVTDALDLGGWKWHHETDSRKSPSGFPDLFAAHPLRGLLIVELKTERGRVRPAQTDWLQAVMVAIGGWDAPLAIGRFKHQAVRVRIWRPSDWREVLDVTGVAAMCIPEGVLAR